MKLKRIFELGIVIVTFLLLLLYLTTTHWYCYFISNEGEKAYCFYEKVTPNALEKLDENECLKIPQNLCSSPYYCSSRTARDNCLSEVFLAKNFLPKDCKMFEMDSSCESFLYYLAIQKRDMSICKLTGENEDICYLEFARLRNDPSICELIDSEATQIFCFRGCLCTFTKNECYMHFAVNRSDISFCHKIDDGLCDELQVKLYNERGIGGCSPTKEDCLREVSKKIEE